MSILNNSTQTGVAIISILYALRMLWINILNAEILLILASDNSVKYYIYFYLDTPVSV